MEFNISLSWVTWRIKLTRSLEALSSAERYIYICIYIYIYLLYILWYDEVKRRKGLQPNGHGTPEKTRNSHQIATKRGPQTQCPHSIYNMEFFHSLWAIAHQYCTACKRQASCVSMVSCVFTHAQLTQTFIFLRPFNSKETAIWIEDYYIYINEWMIAIHFFGEICHFLTNGLQLSIGWIRLFRGFDLRLLVCAIFWCSPSV